MSTIDDIKEQLSCCIDGELDQQELNQLIDNLLEDSSQGEQLRNEWKDLHLISTQSFIDVKNLDIMPNQTDVLPLVDISAQISKKIADEQQIFPLSLEPDLIKAEISSIPDSFGLFKLLAAGSAIAASLVLVVVNVINTENGQFLEKGSDGMTQNIKPEQTPNIAVSRIPVSTPVKKNTFTAAKNTNLPEDISILVNSKSISTGKLYKLIPQQNNTINYSNSPAINSKYSNLIHKVSLKDNQNNKNL